MSVRNRNRASTAKKKIPLEKKSSIYHYLPSKTDLKDILRIYCGIFAEFIELIPFESLDGAPD